MSRPDPFTLFEWKALHREASLVSQILGSGSNALGRASYGSGLGEYYVAFFGFFVGIERLAKLILVADYVLENNGALPGQSVVRPYGHKLKELISKVSVIAEKRSITVPYIGPDHPICAAVVNCLEAFSDGSKGRYANFQAIGNPTFDLANEPVNKWWTEVVELILDRHYRDKMVETGAKQRAVIVQALDGDAMFGLFTDETGKIMSDVKTASERTGQTKWAQKYGRLYTLSVVRWLAVIFDQMTHTAGYEPGLDILFGHYEFFQTYIIDDSFLLKRKIRPLN